MTVLIHYGAACLTTGHTTPPPLHLCVIQSSELSRDEQPPAGVCTCSVCLCPDVVCL